MPRTFLESQGGRCGCWHISGEGYLRLRLNEWAHFLELHFSLGNGDVNGVSSRFSRIAVGRGHIYLQYDAIIFDVREVGLGDATLLVVLLTLGYLQLQETEEVGIIGSVMLGCLLGQLLILAGYGRQPQAFQEVFDEQVLSHYPCLPSSRSYWCKSRSCTGGQYGAAASTAGVAVFVALRSVFRK